MTNASAGLRQQHGYHRCFYRRMFKVPIHFTVTISFGANAATAPGACSFRPSTFCNSWRSAFNYNRAVSNRNEIVEKSPHAKYAAAADNPALNLCRDNFCRDADTAFDRARNRCRTPDTGQYARARRTLVYCARKRIRSCREMEGDVPPQPARNGDDTHLPNSQIRIIGLVQELRSGAGGPDRAGATSTRPSSQISPRIVADTRAASRSRVSMATWHVRG
jgi:hypothetical protein